MKEFFDDLLKTFTTFFKTNGTNILTCILIIIVGGILVKIIAKVLTKIVYSTKIDNAMGTFTISVLQLILWVFILFIALSFIGVSGNSFLVAFSSLALAVGLALKDSLANLANGIVIIITKPFKAGDHIECVGEEGIIKSIRVLTTEITTFDNKKIVLPNSAIVSNAVINYTANPTRRISITFGVGYDSDVNNVKKVILDTLMNMELVLKTPAPLIIFKQHNSSSIDFEVRAWTNTNNYWTTFDQLNEKMFIAFKKNKIEIPFQQVDLHVIENNPTSKKSEITSSTASSRSKTTSKYGDK